MSVEQVSNVVLVGVGGQGILLASEIVARAAMFGGFDVKTNEVHGMAQRGGSVIAQIRFGKEVFSPLVAEGSAQAIGSFEEVEAIRYAHYLAPDGLAVVSSEQVIPTTVSSGLANYPNNCEKRLNEVYKNLVYFNAGKMAHDLGDKRMANTIVLGAMSNAIQLPLDAWEQSIRKSVKPKYVEMNLKAFHAGRDLKTR